MAKLVPVLALLALSTVAAPTQTVLRFRPPVGQTTRYAASVSMNVTGNATPKPVSFTQNVPFTLRIAARQGAVTTLQSKIGQVRVILPPGSPMAAGKAQMEKAISGRAATTRVNEQGSIQGTPANAAVTGMSGLGKGAQGIVFPAKAIKVGDTWGGVVDMSRIGGMTGGTAGMSGKVPIVYKLARLQNGVATVTMSIQGTANLPSPQPMRMVIRYQGSFDVDAKTGLLRQMRATNENDITLQGKGTMHQRIVVTTRAL